MLNKSVAKVLAISLLFSASLTACSTPLKTPKSEQTTVELPANSNNQKPDLKSSEGKSENTKVDVAQYAKPAVVRIISGSNGTASWSRNGKNYELSALVSGSGFFINPDGYIVTNAHVTQANQDINQLKEELFKDFAAQLAKDYKASFDDVFNDPEVAKEFNQSLQLQSINNVILSNGTRLPYEVKLHGKPAGEGKDVSIIKVEAKNAPVLKLGNSDEVNVSDSIKAFGYPGSGDSDVLSEKSLYKATTSSGEISAKKESREGSPILQISASVAPGSSGGPIVNNESKVIGIVTFGGNLVNGQDDFSSAFAVPSNTIMEFVKQAGITNEEGLVNQVYREGLQFYKQGQFNQAIDKFEQVRRLYRNHSEVDELIRQSQEKIIAYR